MAELLKYFGFYESSPDFTKVFKAIVFDSLFFTADGKLYSRDTGRVFQTTHEACATAVHFLELPESFYNKLNISDRMIMRRYFYYLLPVVGNNRYYWRVDPEENKIIVECSTGLAYCNWKTHINEVRRQMDFDEVDFNPYKFFEVSLIDNNETLSDCFDLISFIKIIEFDNFIRKEDALRPIIKDRDIVGMHGESFNHVVATFLSTKLKNYGFFESSIVNKASICDLLGIGNFFYDYSALVLSMLRNRKTVVDRLIGCITRHNPFFSFPNQFIKSLKNGIMRRNKYDYEILLLGLLFSRTLILKHDTDMEIFISKVRKICVNDFELALFIENKILLDNEPDETIYEKFERPVTSCKKVLTVWEKERALKATGKKKLGELTEEELLHFSKTERGLKKEERLKNKTEEEKEAEREKRKLKQRERRAKQKAETLYNGDNTDAGD